MNGEIGFVPVSWEECKMKYDIKNVVLSLLVFTIVAIAITAGAIIVKNGNITKISISSDEVVGTKRNQKYNQNDLEIIETVNNGTNVLGYSSSVRVSGLKNKEIENSINNELATAEQSVRNIFEQEREDGDIVSVNMYVSGNFSNVLSVEIYGSVYNEIKKDSKEEVMCLNYDLTTGNKIELVDVFVPNTDIDLLVQNYIYKDQLHDAFSNKNVFFNPEWWENGKCTYFANEIDEEKFIKEFLDYKKADKVFAITYEGVQIRYGENKNKYAFINFRDCLAKVDIYSKYVTNESIFERNDIGIKNLYVCSNVGRDEGKIYYMIEEPLKNLRIDAKITGWMQDKYKTNEKLKSIVNDMKEKMQSKKDELIKLAIENKDKYHFYQMRVLIQNYYEKGELEGFSVQTDINSYEVSMDDFNNFFENKMIDAYTVKNYYDFESYRNILLTDEEKERCNAKSEHSIENYKVIDDSNTELVK